MLWVQALETFAFLRIFGSEASRRVVVRLKSSASLFFWLDHGTMGVASGEVTTLGVFPALGACLQVVGSKNFK